MNNDNDNKDLEKDEFEQELKDVLEAKGMLPTDEDLIPEEIVPETLIPEEAPPVPPQKKKRFNSRKFRFGTTAMATTAIVVVLVVILNVMVGVLADRYPITWDLTKDKLFSLSEESLKVAKSINKEIQLVVFSNEAFFTSSPTGTPELDTMLKQFYEVTKLYNTYSGGKMTTEFVDLEKNPTLAKKYEKYELTQETMFLFLCGDKYKKASINELFTYDQDPNSGQPTNIQSTVEKTVASRVNSLLNNTDQIVTVFTGHDEDQNTIAAMKSMYELNGYEFKTLALSSASKFDEASTIGVVAAPKKDYTKEEIARLRDWLDNDGKLGRNLMMVTDKTASCPLLYEFLKVEYQVEVTDNLIQETDTNRLLQNGFQYGPYNTIADVASTDYTKGIKSPMLSFETRQLITHAESDPEKTSVYNLDLVTFPETSRLISLAKAAEEATATDKKESAAVKASEYPVVGMALAGKTGWLMEEQKAVNTYVVVCGALTHFYGVSNTNYANEDVLLNVMNTINGHEDAITISSKSLEKPTVRFSQGAAVSLGLFLFTLGIPAITLIICLVVFLRRRHL